MLSNDSDAELEVLTLSIVENPTNGEVQVSQDGSFTYSHDGSNTLSDSFAYSLTDQQNRSVSATVFLTINPIDDVPVILSNQILSVDENSIDGTVVGSILYDDEINYRESDLTGVFSINVENILCGVNTTKSDDYKNGIKNSFDGKVEIVKSSENKYKVNIIVNDSITLKDDWSFGTDCLCWDNLNPNKGTYLDTRGGNVLLNHSNDSLYLSGRSQYAEVQIIENVLADSSNLIFNWRDDYQFWCKVTISRDDKVIGRYN